MRFDELSLYEAVYEVRNELLLSGENPGAEDLVIVDEKRREITNRVMSKLIVDADQRIIDAWVKFRKSTTVNGSKKLDLLIRVSRAHGSRCFYSQRGKGACSDDVHLDRIVPGSSGGEYTIENCMLACGTHNTMRGDKSIEEFLRNSP